MVRSLHSAAERMKPGPENRGGTIERTPIGTVEPGVVAAAATGVALLPIWAEHRRRSRLARNLRGRLLLHVMPLIHIFIGRAAPNSGAFGTDALSGNGAAMKELEAMQALYV